MDPEKIASKIFHKINLSENKYLFGIVLSKINDQIECKGNINSYVNFLFDNLSKSYVSKENIHEEDRESHKYDIHLYKGIAIISTTSIEKV